VDKQLLDGTGRARGWHEVVTFVRALVPTQLAGTSPDGVVP
jgi:hypothetical protein